MKRSLPNAFFVISAFCSTLFVLADRVIAVDAPGHKVTPREPVQSVDSGPFRQQVRTNYTVADGLPDGTIHRLAVGTKLYAATDKGIARFDGSQWQLILPTALPVTGLTALGDKLWFIQDRQLFALTDAGKVNLVAPALAEVKPTSLLSSQDLLYVGTTTGLFVVNSGALVPVQAVNQLLGDETEIRQMAAYDHEIALAAAGGLVSYDVVTKQAKVLHPRNKHVGWAPHDVRGVGFDSQGDLWFAALQGVGHRTSKGWNLYTGHDGLPYNDFTGLATGPSADVWFGTQLGAIRFTGQEWEYRQGKRWLADDVVNDVVVMKSGDAWFATPAGVTRIESRLISMKEKSDFFNAEIDQYHRRTPYGYVDATQLEIPGDKSTGTQYDSDNDGLWTSMYGAGECFEYAVTKTAESKKRADNAFRAVAFLSEVPQGGKQSPPIGFPARSILPVSGPNPNDHDNPAIDQRKQDNDPLWKVITPRWPISADQQWYWKTDTSSDELDGHYFFYALYYDLVADTDEEKRQVRAVVDRVTTHLIEHDYALVDHDGKPTRWGQFSPAVLNTDILTDLRGLNAISILSYLLVAEHVTGDEKYRREYEDLLFKHNYFTNVLNPKHQNGPGSGNQSDDEMAFMCYYSLLKYETNPKLRRQYQRSLARYFAQEEPECCPLFNLIFAAFYEPVRHHARTVPVSIVEDSLESLQRYPLDRVHWGYTNSHRLDIVPMGKHILAFGANGHLRNGKVIPIDERFVNHWNLNPWRLDSNATGKELADGTSFLLPYWLGVYHGLIKETTATTEQP